jgi:hypothetical protein
LWALRQSLNQRLQAKPEYTSISTIQNVGTTASTNDKIFGVITIAKLEEVVLIEIGVPREPSREHSSSSSSSNDSLTSLGDKTPIPTAAAAAAAAAMTTTQAQQPLTRARARTYGSNPDSAPCALTTRSASPVRRPSLLQPLLLLPPPPPLLLMSSLFARLMSSSTALITCDLFCPAWHTGNTASPRLSTTTEPCS